MNVSGMITTFFALILFFCGCLDTQLTTNYTNEEFGFGIDPPENWVLQEFDNVSWIVSWGPTRNSSVLFLITKPYRLDEGLALSTFADDIEETLPNKYLNYSTLNRDWLTIRGSTAYEIEYTYQENNSFIKERQLAIKHTRSVFIIKYSTPLVDYDTFFPKVNNSISTFQIV
jgi:hypothetical protein